uniref:Uncharacterized protein n=1 Tax=Bos mutus grunniens TaxID=30521 RepID=A0A8B9Y1K7_BOSMU
MKGALLLLALLVTRELTFEMFEACPIFYGMFGTVGLGNKTLLNTTLDLVDATDAEKNMSDLKLTRFSTNRVSCTNRTSQDTWGHLQQAHLLHVHSVHPTHITEEARVQEV